MGEGSGGERRGGGGRGVRGEVGGWGGRYVYCFNGGSIPCCLDSEPNVLVTQPYLLLIIFKPVSILRCCHHLNLYGLIAICWKFGMRHLNNGKQDFFA